MSDLVNSLAPMDRWMKKREEGNRRILPLEVTIEILSFLPAKSLVRFRRVCKLWYSITLDPHFIETHLQIRSRDPPTIFLLPWVDRHCTFTAFTFTFTRLDCCDDTSARLNPKLVIPQDVILHASCNGLLCLSNYRTTTTLVVNPVTGDSLTLPPIAPMKLLFTTYFGFEPTTKEYKVLRIFNDDDDDDAIVCQVFTLGTNSSWRQIHASLGYRASLNYAIPLKGVAVKGAIHWQSGLSPWRDLDDETLRFDLLYERFDMITLPCFENFYGESNYLVGEDFAELQGNLSLPVFPNTNNRDPDIRSRMDIWVMTKQEWSIKYTIMFPWDDGWRKPNPLFIRNDKILVHDFQHGSRLQYHDLHTNSYKEVYHHDEDSNMEQVVHVESLVPLPS